jgi:hypothetical protein
MLDLRGGLISIESSIYIRMSLFWIELNFCAARDSIPRFPPPFHLIKNPYSTVQESLGLQHGKKAIQVSGISSFLSAEMLDVFGELSVLVIALTMESPLRIRWDDDNFPGFGFYPTLYKLLATQTTVNESEFGDAVQEMCRLGAIIFLAEVRRRFGIAPIVANVQFTKLVKLLDSNEMLWVKELDHIRVWVIIMSGCAVDNEADRMWAVKSLLRSRVSLGHQDWDIIMNIVSEMWWIDEVFLQKSQNIMSN